MANSSISGGDARGPRGTSRSPGWAGRIRLVLVVTVLVSTGIFALLAPPASAGGVPKFKGAAPGLVACNISLSVGFSPALTESGGGTGKSSVKGKASGCVTTNSAVTITSGAIKGSYATSPLDCATLSATSATLSATVSWKGDVNGVVGAITYAGAATLTKSTLGASTATGSFAGGTTTDLNIPSNLHTSCTAKKGVKKLTLSGNLVLGATTGPGGSGGGGVAGHVVQIEGEGHSGGFCHTACGTYCAMVSSGGVDCWGQGLFGELGIDAQPLDSPTPQSVDGVGGTGTLAGVARLASQSPTDTSFCAVLDSGGVDCWGYDGNGESGDGGVNGAFSLTPVKVTGVGGTGALSGVASVTSGGEGYCALLTSGGVDCWGDNNQSELGDDTTGGPDCSGDCSTPVAVSGLSGVTSVVSDGHDSFCAVLTGTGVDCWGENDWGELGNGTTDPADTPTPVTGLTGVASVVDNPDETGGYCALLTSQTVDCWGADESGEVGPAGGTDSCTDGIACSQTPVAVTGLSDVTSMVADGTGYCAVVTGGSVDCWGDNSLGQLGNGTSGGPDCASSCNSTPAPVSGLTTAVNLSSDDSGYCAVLTSAQIDCWGRNLDNELGAGDSSGPDTCGSQSCSTIPQAVGGVDTAVSQAADPIGYCALLTSASVTCWGSNAFGELGTGANSTGDGTLSASPDTGLTNGESVTVTGSSLASDSLGALLECNKAPDQPTVFLAGVVGASVPVGCSAPGGGDLVSTASDGSLSTTYNVTTGTVGPPCGPSALATCPATDSAGGNPVNDATAYPCPPTPAQQSAGFTCTLQFGDSEGDLVDASILFNGES